MEREKGGEREEGRTESERERERQKEKREDFLENSIDYCERTVSV